jgi:hypothetical protein
VAGELIQADPGGHVFKVAVTVPSVEGEFRADEVKTIRGWLRDYCKRDTLAMVRLHDAVLEHCIPRKRSVRTRREVP